MEAKDIELSAAEARALGELEKRSKKNLDKNSKFLRGLTKNKDQAKLTTERVLGLIEQAKKNKRIKKKKAKQGKKNARETLKDYSRNSLQEVELVLMRLKKSRDQRKLTVQRITILMHQARNETVMGKNEDKVEKKARKIFEDCPNESLKEGLRVFRHLNKGAQRELTANQILTLIDKALKKASNPCEYTEWCLTYET